MTFAEIENGLSAFNVKTNMTPQQIKIFVQDFIDDYSHDSIADLKVCLKNARRGDYGQHYQSIDQLTVMSWFKIYLGEKADARAKRHRAIAEKRNSVLEILEPNQLKELQKNIGNEADPEGDS